MLALRLTLGAQPAVQIRRLLVAGSSGVSGGVSGFFVEATSYATFFTISALTVVPTLLLLAWLWRRLRVDDEPAGAA